MGLAKFAVNESPVNCRVFASQKTAGRRNHRNFAAASRTIDTTGAHSLCYSVDKREFKEEVKANG